MKTLRILALTSLIAGFGLMTGCDTTSATNESPIVKDARLDNSALQAGGGSTKIAGILSDDNAGMSVSFKVLSGTTDKSSSFTIDYKAIPSDSKSWNIGVDGLATIKALSTAATGSYTLVYTLKDKDGASSSASVAFSVTGGSTTPTGTAVTSATVTLGSNNNNTAGSSLDADEMKSYKISDVSSTLQGDIDAYYAYSSTDKADKFFSPSQAKTSGFDGIKTWTVSSTVALYDLTSSVNEATFNALTTQEAIDALFTGKTSAVSVNAVSGTVVGIVTSKGAKRIIRVNSIVAGAAGTVTIKGYK